MPYLSGNAANLIDLRDALRNACTANGWTLAGNVLHKGGAYIETLIVTGVGISGGGAIGTRDYLTLRGGNGIDGSNLLTDANSNPVSIGTLTASIASVWSYVDWAFPITYHIHIATNPDEVWMFVETNAGTWQWLGFGRMVSSANPGTGVFYTATMGNNYTSSSGQERQHDRIGISATDNGQYLGSAGGVSFSPYPFWAEYLYSSFFNGYIHGMNGLTGAAGWSSNTLGNFRTSPFNRPTTMRPIYPQLGRSPNTWNNEAILFPFYIMFPRPDNGNSLIGNLSHVRALRMDFIESQTIIDLSPDKWKVYPAYKKSTGSFAGGIQNQTTSGGMGIAVRYDGV